MKKIILTFSILLFYSSSFAQETRDSQSLVATRINSEIKRQNNCNIIYEKMTKYNCSGFLSLPLTVINKKEDAYCLRLFEIYMTRNCDSDARVVKPDTSANSASIVPNGLNENKDLSFGSQTCQKDKFSDMIGRIISDVDLSVIPKPYRVICNNCPITMDYSPSRMNFKLDESGKITEITCG